jgi:hypothetical protein
MTMKLASRYAEIVFSCGCRRTVDATFLVKATAPERKQVRVRALKVARLIFLHGRA